MTPDEFVTHVPKLYHLAAPGTAQGIARHGLLSTRRLVEFFIDDDEEKRHLLTRRRPHSVILEHALHGRAELNDQSPLSMKALASCLDDGLSPLDWLDMLNSKVFFWPDDRQLQRLRTARRNRVRPRELLVFDTALMVGRNWQRLALSPINSGNTMRRPARRGYSIFAHAADYEWEEWRRLRGKRDRIVEVAIEDEALGAAEALLDVQIIAPTG